jgi:lambda repressor-like predicted transcriptional regulator
VRLTYRGRTRNLQQWADEFGIKRSTLEQRLRTGWTIDKALETPVDNTPAIQLTHKGKTLTLAEWAKKTGLSYTILRTRLGKGWTTTEILETPRYNKPSKAA